MPSPSTPKRKKEGKVINRITMTSRSTLHLEICVQNCLMVYTEVLNVVSDKDQLKKLRREYL